MKNNSATSGSIKLHHTRYGFFVLAYIFSSALFFLSSFLSAGGTDVVQVSRYWSLAVLVQFICFLAIFYFRHKTLNKAYLYFIVAALICWFGQTFVVLFGLETATTPVIFSFNPDMLYRSLQFASMALFVLMSTGLIFVKPSKNVTIGRSVQNPTLRASLNIAGIILVALGAYAYISRQVTNLVTSINYGYGSIFEDGQAVDSVNNIFTNLAMFFIPGLIILLIANKKHRAISIALLCVMALTIILSLSAGGRGGAIALILAMLWLYSTEIKKLGTGRVILLGAVSLVLIRLLNTIAEFRTLAIRSADVFWGIFISGNSQGGSSVGNILNEFGFNIFSLYHTMNLVPANQDFAGGYTYFASLMAVIPSFLFGGYSFSQAAALPDWLKTSLYMDYGPGYSIVAESYYNFGWLGLIAIAVLGVVLIKMLSNNRKDLDFVSIQNGFIAIVLYANLFIARDTSLFVFRKYVYMVIIPTLLIMMIYSFRKRLNHSAHKEVGS